MDIHEVYERVYGYWYTVSKAWSTGTTGLFFAAPVRVLEPAHATGIPPAPFRSEFRASINSAQRMSSLSTILAYDASARISRGTTFMAIICRGSKPLSISASLWGRE